MKKIIIFILLFAALKICCSSSETVDSISIMFDGPLTNEKYKMTKEISVPTATPTDFTLCMWLQPQRIYRYNKILALQDGKDRRRSLYFMIFENKFYIKTQRCTVEPPISVNERMWTQICVVITDIIYTYREGTLVHETDCNKESGRPISAKMVEVTIGASNSNDLDTPFSGKVADLRMYFKKMEKVDVKKIAKVKLIGDSYTKLSDFKACQYDDKCKDVGGGQDQGATEDATNEIDGDGPLQNAPPKVLIVHIEFGTIVGRDLLRDQTPLKYQVINFNNAASLFDAENTCKKFKGRLPVEAKKDDMNAIEKYTKFTSSGETIWFKGNAPVNCTVGDVTESDFNITYSNVNCKTKTSLYVCLVDTSATFKLYGLEHPESLVFTLFDSETKVSKVFEASTKLRIYYFDNRFFIELINGPKILYQSVPLFWSDLLGRHHYVVGKDILSSKKQELTLTACEQNEYTCDDGTCIDLKLACNLKRDCPDRSDETYCDITIDPSKFYDSRLAPMRSKGEKCKLQTSIQYAQLKKIDMDKNLIDITLQMQVSWIDDRITFKSLDTEISREISKKNMFLYWQPFIRISGAIMEDEDKFDFRNMHGRMFVIPKAAGKAEIIHTYEAIVYEGKNSRIYHQNRHSLSIMCIFDLFRFPFDIQTCSFNLSLRSEYTPDVEFDSEELIVIMRDSFNLALYNILKHDKYLPSSDKLTLSIVFERKYGAYLFNTFLPCMMLEVIGLLTHLLPLSDYNDRVAVTLACLIVMAGLFTQMSSNLPPSAEPRIVDIWMFFHIVILFMVFIVHIVVILTHYRMQEKARRGVLPKDQIKENWVTATPSKDHDELGSKFWEPLRHKRDSGRSVARFTMLSNIVGFIICTIVYMCFIAGFAYYVISGRNDNMVFSVQ